MRGYAKRRSDKRGYTTPAGVLPSVTTILGATSKGKARLEAWLKQPNAEAVSADARRRGTWLHSQVEGWIEGAPPRRGFGGGLQAGLHGAYWRNMQPWLETHFVEALAIEKPIWHPKGLSGTFDCLGFAAFGSSPAALTLMDWKTAQRERQGDLLEDYFCQLAAYRLGIEIVDVPLRELARGTGQSLWVADRIDLAERERGGRLALDATSYLTILTDDPPRASARKARESVRRSP